MSKYLIDPKPVNSPKLAHGRVEIGVIRTVTEDGRTFRKEVATLRYATLKAALKVAAALPVNDAHDVINITGYRARDNWQSHSIAQRRQGNWDRPELLERI
jgi:hypothetical protein